MPQQPANWSNKFFATLIKEGKKYGYHVNEKKSWLILKNENDLNKAKSIFSDLSIKITTEGQRHLGAALGSESFKEAYVNEKVAEWHKELHKPPIVHLLMVIDINLHIMYGLYRILPIYSNQLKI